MPHDGYAVGVLAGGAARRFGGRDKGWLTLRGEPMIERTLRLSATGANEVLISANRELDRYRALGCTIVVDDVPDFPGPLAAIAALLAATHAQWLITVPVDVLALPRDLVDRLRAACGPRCGAYAVDDDGVQPLIACYPVAAYAGRAHSAFASGERSVRAWQQAAGMRECRFAAHRFGNLNRPDDLRLAEEAP